MLAGTFSRMGQATGRGQNAASGGSYESIRIGFLLQDWMAIHAISLYAQEIVLTSEVNSSYETDTDPTGSKLYIS